MFGSQLASVAGALPPLTWTVPFVGVIDGQKLLLALALFVLISLGFKVLQQVVVVRLEKLAKKSQTQLDDIVIEALRSIRPLVYQLVAFYIALSLYTLPQTVDFVVSAVLYLVFVWQGIQVVQLFVHYGVTTLVEKDEDGDGVVDPASATVSHMVVLLTNIALWSLGIIFVLSNLGVEITSLIAGLGIGGIAVAFALQGILSDLFASFSLYFDKPFRIGDFVTVGTDAGTVEKIGIKSTRLRDLQGEELVISNAELTSARVHNYKKMQERRVVTQLGITYETPQEKVKQVNGIIERIFADLSLVRLDRVHFKSFGDSALIFELVYYVETADYTEFLNIQQSFNFTLLERFAEVGIEFAYPTQLVYHKAG